MLYLFVRSRLHILAVKLLKFLLEGRSVDYLAGGKCLCEGEGLHILLPSLTILVHSEPFNPWWSWCFSHMNVCERQIGPTGDYNWMQVDIDQRLYPLAGHIMIYSKCIKSICMRHLISRKAYSYRCLLCGATRSRRTCQTAACGGKWQWNHDGGGTWTPSVNWSRDCKQFYCNPWPPLKYQYHATFRWRWVFCNFSATKVEVNMIFTNHHSHSWPDYSAFCRHQIRSKRAPILKVAQSKYRIELDFC